MIEAQFPILKNVAGDNHLRSSGVKPLCRVFGGDAPSDLKSSGPCSQCASGRFIVAGTEFDHVTAGQVVAAILFCEPRGVMVSDEVGVYCIGSVGQGAADDLFHFAVMQVDAGTEAAHDLHSPLFWGRFSAITIFHNISPDEIFFFEVEKKN